MSVSSNVGLIPILDGISLSIPVDYQYEGLLAQEIRKLEKDFWAKPDHYSLKGGSLRQRLHYTHAAIVHLTEESDDADDTGFGFQKVPKKMADALLQLGPISSSANFGRLELNPARLGPERTAKLVGVVNEILSKGQSSIWDGKVTSMDLAIDLPDTMPIGYYWERSPQAKRLSIAGGGAIETMYVGKTRGSNLCVYDRTKKLKQKGPPVCRVERRIRPGLSIAELPALANPFADVKAFDLGVLAGMVPPASFPWFVTSVAILGLRGATAHLPKEAQKRISGKLEKATPPFWQPDLIWAEWKPSLLEAFGMTSPEAWPAPPFLA